MTVAGVMEDAIPQVERGVELARNVAESLGRIHSGAEDTLSHLREVSSATREQSIASNSIASRVEDISQMVEETSTSIHHAAENANEVERIARTLNELVSRFRV